MSSHPLTTPVDHVATAAPLALARRALWFYVALALLAVIAFWPGYIGAPKSGMSGWMHFHVASATLWIALLIAQPWAISRGRRALHVALGRVTYGLAPLVIIGFIGLAHASMQGKTPQGQAVDAYFLYVRVVLLAMFAATYALGVIKRSDPAVHSRYMVCTGLALVDPVLHRLGARAMEGADVNYQLLTFGVVCATLVAMICLERHARRGRYVFPLVLAGFVAGGLPLALDFHTWGAPWTAWKALAAKFASLPLP